jgi:hypothetical protein
VAKQSSEFHRYAVMGAEQRLLQIAAEAQEIFRHFPELRRRGRGFDAAVDGGQTPSAFRGGGADRSLTGDATRGARKKRGPGRPRGRRRTISAEGRRRISEAQKARWARQKAGSTAAPKAGASKKK